MSELWGTAFPEDYCDMFEGAGPLPHRASVPESMPCRKCSGPIADGETCYDIGLVHDLNAGTSRIGYEHLEGRCE